MKLHAVARAIAGLSLAFAASSPAWSANIAYMSGAGGEPWGSNSNLSAMDTAFGAGNWDRVNFGASLAGYSFVYIDGSDSFGSAFKSYVTSNQSALESFVTGGGHLFLNVASNDLGGQTYNLLFGTSTVEGGSAYSATATAVNPAAPMFAGAGTAWSGNYFAHNQINTTAAFTTFITGDLGQSLLAGGTFGSGYLLLGGQTTSNFHSANTGDAALLRSNELSFAATNAIAAAVPEPQTYALMLAGLGAVGFVAKRRKV